MTEPRYAIHTGTRRWGIIVTAFYAAVVVGLLWPGIAWIAGGARSNTLYSVWAMWVWAAMLIGGQALLLFLVVDTSWRRIQPRRHVLLAALVVAMAVALLTFAAVFSIATAFLGDRAIEASWAPWHDDITTVAWWLGLWLFWGIAFYCHYRNSPARIGAAVALLLKGSVLELLIAVPAHVAVRQREECSAPVVSGFGIATGIAIMLACFGPSVVLLYRKRCARYRKAGGDRAVTPARE